jgi:hypothetical protein
MFSFAPLLLCVKQTLLNNVLNVQEGDATDDAMKYYCLAQKKLNR